jgi:hypothetical protein
MRAFEFTKLVETPEIESVQSYLKKMGFIDFKRKGNTIYGIVEIPPKQKNKEFRIQKMKDISVELSKILGKQVAYNPTQTSHSTIGYIEIEKSPIQIVVKDAKKQGENRAGVANEHQLVVLMQKQIQEYGSVDVTFKDDSGKTLTIEDATTISGTGTDTKGGKKADVVIGTGSGGRLPVSIKQVNADVWESADTLFGKRARVIVDKLKSDGSVELQKIGERLNKGQTIPVFRLNKEIVVEPTPEDAMKAIFGSDLNPAGGIVIQDFQDHHFLQTDNKIIIDCYAVIKTKEDIPESHMMYFLIKNFPGRASLGYSGIGTQAVTMTRAFGKNLVKTPIFVDQAGNEISKPAPRNPQI